MKRLRILSIFMVLFTALGSMVSCETEPVDPLLLTDDNGGIDPTPDPGVFTVKIGSTLFVADSTVATLGDGFIVIKGYKGTEGENVTITIPATTTGTYAALMVYDPGATLNFYSNLTPAGLPSGSVTITNINTVARTVSGNFNFTGYYSDPTQNIPPTAFTEGTYTNISYAGGTTPPVNPTGPGSFKVDIDGQPFVADEADAYLGSRGFSIGGYKDNGEKVYIILDTEETITPTTYTNASMTYSLEIHGNPGYNNSDNSGTLTITEIDTVNRTVSGTFSFTGNYSEPAAGLPAKELTNGVFTDVPYSDEENFGDEFIAVVTPTGGNSMDNDYSSNLISGLFNNTINIQAIGAEDEIRLAINSSVRQGTYVFTNSIGSDYKATFEVDDVDYPINGGSLTIISNENGRLKGSFNFEVKDETGAVLYTITSGNFDVEYDF
jgi:hypothetical protein